MVRALAVLGIVLLAGCSDVAEPPRHDAVASVRETALEPLVDALLVAQPSRGPAAVLADLGEPDRVEVEPVQNRYDRARVDTLRSLHYPGLEVVLYEVDHLDTSFPVRITVNGSGYATAEGVRVGSSRAEVEAALGRPASVEGKRYLYYLDPDVPDRFEILFEDDRVALLEWLPYWD